VLSTELPAFSHDKWLEIGGLPTAMDEQRRHRNSETHKIFTAVIHGHGKPIPYVAECLGALALLQIAYVLDANLVDFKDSLSFLTQLLDKWRTLDRQRTKKTYTKFGVHIASVDAVLRNLERKGCRVVSEHVYSHTADEDSIAARLRTDMDTVSQGGEREKRNSNIYSRYHVPENAPDTLARRVSEGRVRRLQMQQAFADAHDEAIARDRPEDARDHYLKRTRDRGKRWATPSC